MHEYALRGPAHVLSCHLGDALDDVRRSEFRRLSEKGRSFIKGQRYTLLSNFENLTTEERASLKKLLAANKRLNTAYLLKESFDRLWTYKSEVWIRKFFDNWRDSLKWQRLKPFEKFAALLWLSEIGKGLLPTARSSRSPRSVSSKGSKY